MKRVILDMDPGVDDAMAILLALKSPELKVEAITVVSGNIKLDLCLKNTLRRLSVNFLPQRLLWNTRFLLRRAESRLHRRSIPF